MQYILIADSGSTKTDWCVVQNGQQQARYETKGMNPFFQTQNQMEDEIRQNLLPQLPNEQPTAVYFYGAGCTPEKSPLVKESLERCFPDATTIEVNSDLLAAARALCGHQPGIACILGTGSNSCFYDGKGISFNVPALGFILGDEGSGANLGKRLVGDILKNQFPGDLRSSKNTIPVWPTSSTMFIVNPSPVGSLPGLVPSFRAIASTLPYTNCWSTPSNPLFVAT